MHHPELTPYEQEQQRLRNVARLILPLEPMFLTMPKVHIEEVVIWLKRIHTPADMEDRSWEATEPFKKRVEELRNIPEQIEYQNQAILSFRRAFFFCIGIGALAVLALWGVVQGFYWSLCLLIAVPYCWRKAVLSIHQTLLTAKEQDQKHLLGCIREAKSVRDLNTAGLYAHLELKEWDDDKQDFDTRTQQMRDAIYCRGSDGYMFAAHMKELKAGYD